MLAQFKKVEHFWTRSYLVHFVHFVTLVYLKVWGLLCGELGLPPTVSFWSSISLFQTVLQWIWMVICYCLFVFFCFYTGFLVKYILYSSLNFPSNYIFIWMDRGGNYKDSVKQIIFSCIIIIIKLSPHHR